MPTTVPDSLPPPHRPVRPSRVAPLARTLALMAIMAGATAVRAAPPQIGDAAPQLVLKTLDDRTIDFAEVAKSRSAVLVVLRGWPGYQCPFCTTQVYEYVEHAAEFAARDMVVVMVYPGPAAELQAHAAEFLGDKRWPANFHFVLDPDYAFSASHGLRWEGEGETVYPATFVMDPSGRIRFAHVSREHGDRVGAAALLRLLAAKK